MKVIIIGAGPGGIAAGKRLQDAGIDDFVILEQAAGVGGTWWHNRYPGCRCDVPSHLYSFSFSPKADWTEPYAKQAEIQRYMEDVVAEFALTPHIRLNQKVVDARWNESDALWRVQTENGEVFTGRALIGAVGMFNEPSVPAIAGLSDFQGVVMHSARWRPEVDLRGKRVAVIGSAASATQFVPTVAREAASLDVYQRTPNYVGPKQQEFFTDGERDRLMADPAATAAERQRIWSWLEAVIPLDDPELLGMMKAAALANLENVQDPEMRRLMTPDYPMGSKRGLTSNEWYPTFNLPHVSLQTAPIERIGTGTIRTEGGAERPADIIILATGFQTTRFLSTIPVFGRDGARLDEIWADGARAYLGITASGFPNMFMIYGPNTNNGSIIEQIENQVGYIVRKLEFMRDEGLDWIDVTAEAVDDYNVTLQKDIAAVDVWQASARDYYRSESGLVVTQWPHTMARYREETLRRDEDRYLRSEGNVEGTVGANRRLGG